MPHREHEQRCPLPLAEPVVAGVRPHLGARAKVMVLARDEVNRPTAARVEVQGRGLGSGVDGHDHALACTAALEHQLLGLALQLVVVAHAERLALEPRGRKGGDEVRELTPLGCVERGALP